MTADQHRAELETWRAVVGKAIVCFGELELITYKCLAHIPSDRISETSSRLNFARRVDLIVEILEGRAPLPANVATFVKKLRRAKELAQTRNDIAHNPVMLNVFVHEASGDVALENCIATARGGRFIDLAGAKEFADEVENLASEMWLQIGKITEHNEAASN
jgi:hypothetical protein